MGCRRWSQGDCVSLLQSKMCSGTGEINGWCPPWAQQRLTLVRVKRVKFMFLCEQTLQRMCSCKREELSKTARQVFKKRARRCWAIFGLGIDPMARLSGGPRKQKFIPLWWPFSWTLFCSAWYFFSSLAFLGTLRWRMDTTEHMIVANSVFDFIIRFCNGSRPHKFNRNMDGVDPFDHFAVLFFFSK